MMIDLKCPCGERFQVDEQYAGCRARCPECKRVAGVPRRKPRSENPEPRAFAPKDRGYLKLSVEAACPIGPCKSELFKLIEESVREHLEYEHGEDCRGRLIITVREWRAVNNMLRMSLVCQGELTEERIECEASISRISQAALQSGSGSPSIQELSTVLEQRAKGCVFQLCAKIDRAAGVNVDEPIKWYVSAQVSLIVVAILLAFVATCFMSDISFAEIFGSEKLAEGMQSEERQVLTGEDWIAKGSSITNFFGSLSISAFWISGILQWFLLFVMPNRFYTHDPRGRKWLEVFYASTPFYLRLNMTLTTVSVLLFFYAIYIYILKPLTS